MNRLYPFLVACLLAILLMEACGCRDFVADGMEVDDASTEQAEGDQCDNSEAGKRDGCPVEDEDAS